MKPTAKDILLQLAALIEATGLTVHDYARHVLHTDPRNLYVLGLSGGGATPVVIR